MATSRHKGLMHRIARGRDPVERLHGKKKFKGYKHGIDAVHTVAVISSFIFAFAFSIYFSIDIDQHFQDEDTLNTEFTICILFVIILSGFSTFSMTAHYYSLQVKYQNVVFREYNAESYLQYSNYIEDTSMVRKCSRYSVIISFFFLYLGIIIYSYTQFDLLRNFISSCIIISFGILLNVWSTVKIFGLRSCLISCFPSLSYDGEEMMENLTITNRPKRNQHSEESDDIKQEISNESQFKAKAILVETKDIPPAIV